MHSAATSQQQMEAPLKLMQLSRIRLLLLCASWIIHETNCARTEQQPFVPAAITTPKYTNILFGFIWFC